MLFFAALILFLAYREQTVKARQESEKKYRLFFENTPIGIIHYDHHGIITDANEAMIAIFGSSREKFIGLDQTALPLLKISPKEFYLKEKSKNFKNKPYKLKKLRLSARSILMSSR